MPRTLQEIIDHADELSAAFDDIQPDPAAGRDPAPLLRAREAVQARAHAEADVADAVAVMRAAGYSWQAIGAVVGTSGEAARQRYGGEAPKPGASTATTSGPVKTVRAESAPKTTRRAAKSVAVKHLAKSGSGKSSAAKSAARSSAPKS